ncbi:MAG: hypothetical protein M1813_006141 [Trichoglossum hirsutum]|nr:MAG: hypothetical protein M1813_006141 [Trichoglossum hirsutum]
MEATSRKRAHTIYSVNGDGDSASSTKRSRNTVDNQEKVQEFVPQGGEFNTHGDALAQASDEENSKSGNNISGSDTSFGVEQLETSSDGDSLISSPKQTDAKQTIPRVNWNAGAKSKIRTTLGSSEGTRLKPSLLEAQTSPSRLMQPDRRTSVAKEYEPDQELKIEGPNSISSSADPELHLLLDMSKEQGIAATKRLENTKVRELSTNLESSSDDSNRILTSPLQLEGPASNFEAVPMVTREGEGMMTKIQNSPTGGRHMNSPGPWLSLDLYTIICRFVHRLPKDRERRERVGRQELYKCKYSNAKSEDFKALPQELRDGSLEELRAHLFSFDLKLPQLLDEPELEQRAAAKHGGDGNRHDLENQAEVIFFRHLDEQRLADPGRREAIHETEIAFTKRIIEGYQYDHLMCTLLTPDERYEKGIGSLQHIHPHRTPHEYREYILEKCNRVLMDLDNPKETGMARFQRMTKVDCDKIIYEYGDPLAQETGDKKDGDSATLSDGRKREQGEYGCVHDNSLKRSSSSYSECSSNTNLEREIHEVEVSYWQDQISREQYNKRRWKLYTAREAKEKALEWPRRRVHSPAGYRDSELDYPAHYMEQKDSNDVLLEFGVDIQDAEAEAAATERFKERIETEFPDIEARQTEYGRWEEIRKVEADFHHHRISRDEYNEQRYPLYTDSEIEERGIEWPHCQSPAGRRDDIFDTFVRDEPSYEARMEFHWPYPSEYEDTSDEVQLCELCASLIKQQRIENSEKGKARAAQQAIKAAEAKAKQAKRDAARATKALEGEMLRVDKAKKKKDKVQAVQGNIQTKNDAASNKKGINGSLAEGPQIPSLPNSTEASEPGVDLVELPRDSPNCRKARVVASKQYGLSDDGGEGSKDEGEVSEADVNLVKPKHIKKSEPPLSEYKPATTWKSKMDLEAGSSSKRSPLELNMVPPQPTISGLLTPEKQLQSRYFSKMQPSRGTSSNDNNITRCLVCVGEGHTADNCPELTYVRCDKCHERGHAINSCPSKLARSEAADGLKCDLCEQMGHFENSCSRIWRTTFSPDSLVKKVSGLPIFCYNCGACGHFGTDCRLQLGETQPRSTLGGSSFALDNANRFLLTRYRIERKSEFSIKGRATHRIREDSESEEFFRPPVAGATHGRRLGRGNAERGNGGKSLNRPIRVHISDNHRARSSPRQPGPSSDCYYRPLRGEREREHERSPSPLRHPRDDWRDGRRDNYQGRGEGRGSGGFWQPPLPREPPPAGRGRGGGRDRGQGREYNSDAYRPMPSAAKNARRQFRR